MSTTKTSAQVPKLRFPGFSDDAFQIKLGEVAKVTSGGTPSRQIPTYWDGQIPWVTTSLIDFNRVSCAEEFITDEGLDNSSAKLFPKGTVIMALYGQGVTRGKVAILEFEATTNQACAAMLIHDRRLVNEYLFYDLQRRYTELRQLSNDGSQKNLSGDLLKNLEVTLPYVPEQQKIAAFLTAVDGRIEQLSRKKALLEATKKGVMQQLFTQTIRFQDDHGHDFPDWEEKTLGNLFPEIRNGFVGTATPFYCEDGVRYIQGRNIKAGRIIENDFVEITHAFHQKCRKSQLQTNDILMVQSGHVGECAVVTTDYSGSNCHALLVLTPKPKTLDSRFFVYFFYSEIGRRKIHIIATGNTVEHILSSDLKNVSVPLPSIEEQTKIAGFLSALDGKIGAVGEQMRQTQAWKKGLLQQMFV